MRLDSHKKRAFGTLLLILASSVLFAEHRWARNRIYELETTSKRRTDELVLICSQLALLQELTRNGSNDRSVQMERLVGQAHAQVGRSSRLEPPQLRMAVAALDGLIKARNEKPDAKVMKPDSLAQLYKSNFLEFKNAVDQLGAIEASRRLGDGKITWLGYVRSYDSAEFPPRISFGPTQIVGKNDLVVSVILSASLFEGNQTVQISQLVKLEGICAFIDNRFIIPSPTVFEVISPD